MRLMMLNIVTLSFILLLSTNRAQSDIILMPEALYPNPENSAKVENYILQHQRQFEEQIKNLDKRLDDSRKRFSLRLDVIEYYDAIIDVKLKEMEDKLDPLEMLGDINNFCVQKYRGRIPAEGVLKANLKTCITKSNQAFGPVLTNAENSLKNIKNHFNNQFTNAMKDCKRKNAKNETKYQLCAANGIKSTTNFFITNTDSLLNQLSIAECSATAKIDEAFDCYSAQVTQTFTTFGEVTGLIENCMAGHEFCPACDGDDPVISKGRCPYQMAWHLNDDDLTGDKIVNPFKGINSTTPCLQINFVTKSFDVVLN